MGQLVELAEEILRHAKTLEAQLEAASAPPPTLDAGGPMLYPKWSQYPEIFRTRSALVDASKDMYQLALGPGDTIRSLIGVHKMEGFVLNVIAHYDIANIVPRQGSMSFEDLAAKISVQQGILERVMRFAFSINLFKTDQNGHISHTALSEAVPTIAGFSWLTNRKEISCALSSWPDSMAVYAEPNTTGVRHLPWNVGNDMDTAFFDYLNAEPDGMKLFGNALKSHTAINGADTSYIIDGFDWASLGKGPVIDLGGGNGYMSIILAEAFPDLHLIVQDLPFSETAANALIPVSLKDRVTFQVHDFFKPQTSNVQAKAFFLKAIIHDWLDDDCVKILRNLLPVVEKGAKIVMCDRIPPPPGRKPTHMESFVLFIDLLMFSVLGSKERNIDQWKILLKKTDPRLKILSFTQPVGSEFGMVVVGIEQ